MILITSADYIGPEFRSELGKIPPSFLPIGNQRLYRYQHEYLKAKDKIVLTIPENFSVPKHDLRQIESMAIEILPIPEGLSLGDSIVCALNLSGYSQGLLTILHGDTLVHNIPEELDDIVAVSSVEDNYEWATFDGTELTPLHSYEKESQASKQVVNGYFRFSDARVFIQSMVRARGSFIKGVNLYAKTNPLKAHVTKSWYDFGHLHTYFRSKTHISTARSFNKLNIEDGVVTKLSDMPNKMAAESQWFTNIPSSLKKYTPNFLGEISDEKGTTGYQIEYQCLSSLNELFVFGELPVFVWEKILKACTQFIETCAKHPSKGDNEEFNQFLITKTNSRLEAFQEQTGISLTDSWTFNGATLTSIKEMHEASTAYLPEDKHQTVTHGDFCFSNILYDFRVQSVKVIDPRGLNNKGELTTSGFSQYDIAKLAHSILGKYDFIIAGYFDLKHTQNSIDFELFETENEASICALFETICLDRFALTKQALCAMQIQLFLSMLPLHSDKPNRQLALLANAMKLYTELEKTP